MIISDKVFYFFVYTFAVLGAMHLIIKPIMDILEFVTYGFLFENQSLPANLKSNNLFKAFRYTLNLLTGVRL